jgi:hypothetical protein
MAPLVLELDRVRAVHAAVGPPPQERDAERLRGRGQSPDLLVSDGGAHDGPYFSTRSASETMIPSGQRT